MSEITRYSKELKEEIRVAYMSGQSLADLAKKHGIPPQTVSRWKRVYAWDREVKVNDFAGTILEIVVTKLRSGEVKVESVADIDILLRGLSCLMGAKNSE